MRTCLQATHRLDVKEKDFGSPPACGVYTPDSHPPPTSGQESSLPGQIVTKFSRRLPSCVFPHTSGHPPNGFLWCQAGMGCLGTQRAPRAFLLLPLPLYFAQLSNLTQVQVKSETSPANGPSASPVGVCVWERRVSLLSTFGALTVFGGLLGPAGAVHFLQRVCGSSRDCWFVLAVHLKLKFTV